MIIERIPVGPLEANCYLAAAKDGGDAVVIDPGGDVERILAAARKHEVRIVKILNTHGHWDHIGANPALSRATGAEFLIHQEDAGMIGDPFLNLSLAVSTEEFSAKPDGVFADGESFKVGEMDVKAIHTPGHTPGSSAFLIGDNLFSGDLLFYESVGRTDLPGSDEGKLYESIQSKILTLPDATTVWPGHGDRTTVGWEREHNPYVSGGRLR